MVYIGLLVGPLLVLGQVLWRSHRGEMVVDVACHKIWFHWYLQHIFCVALFLAQANKRWSGIWILSENCGSGF